MHLLDIVNRVLDLANIDAGKVNLQKEPYTIAELMERPYKMVGVLAEKKSIMVNGIFYLDGKGREDLIGEPKLNVDRTRCEQIFINLLNNAVKYSPRQSQIHCRVKYVSLNGSRCAKVQIINEGGMKSNDVKKALARFGTLSEGQYTTHEGAVGLGTSIVQGLVELHAGKFELLSRKTPNANLTIANVYLPF